MPQNKAYTCFLLGHLLCLFALLIAACGGNPSPSESASTINKPAATDKQILRLSMGESDFPTIDPAHSQSNAPIIDVFTGLVEIDSNGMVFDQLAASHKMSDDGLTYTFRLKPELKFSDGTPLTTSDVAYSINRLIDPATKSAVAFYVNLLKDYDAFQGGKVKTLIGDSIIVQDTRTITLKLSRPGAYFLEALAYPASYVVEKSVIEKYGAQWTDHLNEGGGIGPFKVQSYSHTQGMVLVPDANYYGRHPQIQKLIYRITGDRDTTWRTFLAGQLDFAVVPPTQDTMAESMPGYHNVPSLAIRYIALNYLVKPLDNIKIRQALALAINKDLIVKTILSGVVIPTNHIIPKGMPGYNEGLIGPAGVAGTAGDPNKAKQLFVQGLHEEGYVNADALPSLILTGFTGYKAGADTLTAIIDQWHSVLGITVKLNLMDVNALQDQIVASAGNPRGLQMWYSAWGANYPDPQDWLSIFFEKEAGNNNTFNYGQNTASDAAEQQAIQQELAQADVNPDTAARMKTYDEAEQQIVNDVGWLPTYQTAVISVINPHARNLPGLTSANESFAPDDWADAYISQ